MYIVLHTHTHAHAHAHAHARMHARTHTHTRAYLACRHSLVCGILHSKWACDIIIIFSSKHTPPRQSVVLRISYQLGRHNDTGIYMYIHASTVCKASISAAKIGNTVTHHLLTSTSMYLRIREYSSPLYTCSVTDSQYRAHPKSPVLINRGNPTLLHEHLPSLLGEAHFRAFAPHLSVRNALVVSYQQALFLRLQAVGT